MKLKNKNEKAITLIALVITIIVLLILAGVTISTLVGENGILTKTSQAKLETEKAAAKEKIQLEVLGSYDEDGNLDINKLKENLKNIDGVTFDETAMILPLKVTLGNTKYMITSSGEIIEGVIDISSLKIGDKVNYNEGTGYSSDVDSNFTTENLEWRVLGVNDNGQVELISTNPTESLLPLIGKENYKTAETKLNTLCNDLYGNGTGAESARSLNVDDINKLANYDPKTYVHWDGKKYGDQKVFTSGTFINYDGTEVVASNTNKVSSTFTYYKYILSDEITTKTSDGKLLADIITKGEGEESYKEQWLASRCVLFVEGDDDTYAYFYIRCLYSEGDLRGIGAYSSNGNSEYGYARVRPVVTLKSGIQLVSNSNGSYDIY